MNSPIDSGSTPIPTHAFDQGASAEKTLCTVKETAFRIQKSTSTVYRMRSHPGQLRFILDGHRIYVEAESLEALLSTNAPAEDCVETPSASGGGCVDDVAVGRNPEVEPGLAGGNPSNESPANPDAIGRSGQRDLIILPRERPLLILYMV